MHKMNFGCFAASNKAISRSLLLAESIRTFAGEFSNLPFLLMLPGGDQQLTKKQQEKVDLLEVDLVTFELDPQAARFPFAGKVVAAAAAEIHAGGTSSQLVWMDDGTLVVNPLDSLLLRRDLKLGYRPVDHLLVGSPFDQPIDAFWNYIYQVCGVSSEDIFSMCTSTDQVKMRPYFNAGMLVVRPREHLLQVWRDTFLEIYQGQRALDFYEDHHLYRIFIHQAVLAGCVLYTFRPSEMLELPHMVNYPLHMHTQYPAQLQPSAMNQLVSFRYEDYFSQPGWQLLLPVEPPLMDWLSEREEILAPG